MPAKEAMLHLVCGKIASGKSTLVARLGECPETLVVSEDHWLARLYPDAQTCLADYARNATRLKSAIGPHLIDLLRAGLSVVLDFPANTLANRTWMRTLFETAGVEHTLHYLDVSDDVCKERLRARNARGEHDFTVTDEEFDLFTSYFVAPSPEEDFNLIVYRSNA